jgi:hypothetical protein
MGKLFGLGRSKPVLDTDSGGLRTDLSLPGSPPSDTPGDDVFWEGVATLHAIRQELEWLRESVDRHAVQLEAALDRAAHRAPLAVLPAARPLRIVVRGVSAFGQLEGIEAVLDSYDPFESTILQSYAQGDAEFLTTARRMILVEELQHRVWQTLDVPVGIDAVEFEHGEVQLRLLPEAEARETAGSR